jgi:hypothetical protein
MCDHRAIRPDQHADGATLTLEREELVGDLRGFDFNLAEIGRALRKGERCTERENGDSERARSDVMTWCSFVRGGAGRRYLRSGGAATA